MDVQTIGEGEGDRGFMEGPEATARGTLQRTADNADGTVTVTIRVKAQDVPDDLQMSPDGSLWRLHIETASRDDQMNVVRTALRDTKAGCVDLRFIVLPAGLAPEAIWGRVGQDCTLKLRMLAGRHPYPHFVQRAERAACMRRTTMLCSETAFGAWCTERATADGLPVAPLPATDEAIGMDTATALSLQAAENLCRLARIHSRREILSSNAAAERVETLIRAYREHAWQKGTPAREADKAARGLVRRYG
jgi:hypothetical protein